MIAGRFVRVVLGGLAALLALPAVASANRHLYVTTDGASDVVSTFAFGPDGAPLAPTIAPVPTGADPEGVALTPDGAYLYVANAGDNTISAYGVAPGGQLTALPGAPAPTGISPTGIAVTPDGAHVYVTNLFGASVSGYVIAADGTLTELEASPFPAGTAPFGVAASPDGGGLYVANEASSEISAYDIEADGSLTEKAGSPYTTTNQPRTLAITPDGSRLFSGSAGNTITAFTVGAGGDLTPVVGSPFPRLATGLSRQLAITPTGGNLLVTGYTSANAASLAIGPGGVLAPAGSPAPAGDSPTGIAVAPSGQNAYVATAGSDELFSFSFGPGGSLSPLGEPVGLPDGDAKFQSVSITPNQPPAAAFSLGTTPSDVVATFNANASIDPDGAGVSSYRWDFGDGQTQTTAIPTTTHKYATNGVYDVTLRVTDVEGCSTSLVYTGQTALCNGSGVAQITKSIDTTAPPQPDNRIKNPQLVLRPTQRQGKQIRVVAKVGAGEAARIKLRGFIRQSKQKIKLKKRTVQVKGTNRKQVNLKVRSSGANMRVRKLIRKAGAIRATVIADLRDDAGNTAQLRRNTTLMLKKRKRR